MLRAGGPASQELGKGHGESLAALKQELQLSHVHAFGVGSNAQVPCGVAKGHFLWHSLVFWGDSAQSQMLCSEVEGEGSVQPGVTHSGGTASPSAK